MDANRDSITQKGRRFQQHLRQPPPMSLDASHLLDSLTLIDYHKVTGSSLIVMEMFMRGYSKMARYLTGDIGRLMIQAVMIFINSLRGMARSRKRESNYQASRN
jgi:hypothetical protein